MKLKRRIGEETEREKDETRLGAGSAALLAGWSPKVIEATLPLSKLFFKRYLRAFVVGLENIPEEPALFVGVHGGGALLADANLIHTSFYVHTRFKRPLFAMAHKIVMMTPGMRELSQAWGTIEAHPENARTVLRLGHSLIVFPGGVRDMARTWNQRNKVDFHGRYGFVRMALEAGVPIVPVGTVGGHETHVVLSDGRKLAEKLGLRKRFRLEVLPISLTIPWGLTLGFLPYWPLPTQVGVAFGKPIRFSKKILDAKDSSETMAAAKQVEQAVQSLVYGLVKRRETGDTPLFFK